MTKFFYSISRNYFHIQNGEILKLLHPTVIATLVTSTTKLCPLTEILHEIYSSQYVAKHQKLTTINTTTDDSDHT